MNIADAIFLPIVLIVLSIMIFRDLRFTFRKRASEKWPAIEAVIDAGEIGFRGLLCRVHFTYSYEVNGQRRTGRFSLLTNSNKSGEALKQTLIGKKTGVKYDTRDPDISLLAERQFMGERVMQGPSWTYR
jgi:hypothetical protein